jgi:hypothetical protein
VFKFDEESFFVLEAAGQAVIGVERSGGETGAVSVAYHTVAGTAKAGSDFRSASGVLTWAAGDESTKTFVVVIITDDVGEPSESLSLVLDQPTGGATVDSLRGTAPLTIADDDDGAPADDGGSPGILKFDEDSYLGVEGGAALIRVERSNGEHGAVSVSYSISEGSAHPGADYTPVSGVLHWASGDGAAKTFSVPIADDSLSEGGETATLRLSSPAGGATIGANHGSAILQIMDTDGSKTPCDDSGSELCLVGGRFRVEVHWRTQQGATGSGTAVAMSDNSGSFWFFAPDNTEMLLKVLDACSLNNRFWVFFSATTNVGYTVQVTDTAKGFSREYSNPIGFAAAAVTDTQSFATCN